MFSHCFFLQYFCRRYYEKSGSSSVIHSVVSAADRLENKRWNTVNLRYLQTWQSTFATQWRVSWKYMRNLCYCLGLLSLWLDALNANSRSAQQTVGLGRTVGYTGSPFQRTSRAASERAHQHSLMELQLIHLPTRRFSVWVTRTLILPCAASFINYFSSELSLSMPVVRRDFSTGLQLESADFTFVNLKGFFIFYIFFPFTVVSLFSP